MGKRIGTLLLAVIFCIAIVPSERYAAEMICEGQKEEKHEEWNPPACGSVAFDIIEISAEEARSLRAFTKEEQGDFGQEEKNPLLRGSQKYAVSWDVYSSNYIYNRLGEKEKELWDDMDDLCRSYLTGSKDAIHYDVTDKNGNKRWCYLLNPVFYSVKDLKKDKVSEVISFFCYANPQYYFLDGCLYHDNGEIWFIVYDAFGKGKNRKASTEKMKQVIDGMEQKIAKEKSDIEKARTAHDLIIKYVKYDHLNQTPYEQSPYHQSAYSVFCKQSTVCTGYAMAFELLMNGAGVDTFVVISEKYTHAWNMICLKSTWYHVDCTWDDLDGSDGKEVRYTYFGRSTDMLKQLDQSISHRILPSYENYVPKCIWDSKATETGIGTYEMPTAVAKRPKITQKKVSGGIMVTIKATDPGTEIYYTLDGKKPSASFSRSYLYRKPFRLSKPVTVKAVAVCGGKWDSEVSTAKINAKCYQVTFHSRGGSKVKSQKVFANSKVKKPSAPKRSGYRFAGWYQDKKCKKAWDFGKKVKRNLVLYAKWKKKR